MTKHVIQWGMIGCGNVTKKKSAPSFNKISNSRLVAVGNRTSGKAEDYAKRHGVPTWHRDPFDVIYNPDVHIVYVSTPPGSHMKYALETIKAGKPVYLEKPMALNYEECRIINEAAIQKGVSVFVAYYRRSLEYFNQVKEVIESGILGRIQHINIQQYFPARDEDYNREALPWRLIPADSGGGYFHDLGCHALDILFYIFGNPESISGSKTNVGGVYDPEDTIVANLMLPNNLLVAGSWSFVTPKPFQKDLVEVVGEKGMMKFSIFSFKPITLMLGKNKESIPTLQPEHIQMPLIQTIVSELNGEGTCPSTGETASVTSKAMDQILGVG